MVVSAFLIKLTVLPRIGYISYDLLSEAVCSSLFVINAGLFRQVAYFNRQARRHTQRIIQIRL